MQQGLRSVALTVIDTQAPGDDTREQFHFFLEHLGATTGAAITVRWLDYAAFVDQRRRGHLDVAPHLVTMVDPSGVLSGNRPAHVSHVSLYEELSNGSLIPRFKALALPLQGVPTAADWESASVPRLPRYARASQPTLQHGLASLSEEVNGLAQLMGVPSASLFPDLLAGWARENNLLVMWGDLPRAHFEGLRRAHPDAVVASLSSGRMQLPEA